MSISNYNALTNFKALLSAANGVGFHNGPDPFILLILQFENLNEIREARRDIIEFRLNNEALLDNAAFTQPIFQSDSAILKYVSKALNKRDKEITRGLPAGSLTGPSNDQERYQLL
jgi:hypothetical protein